MTTGDRDRRATALGWMVLAIFCTAGIAILGHFATHRADWRWVLLIRAVIGTLLSWLIVRRLSPRMGQGARGPLLIFCGAAGLSIAMYFFALARVPSSDAMVLLNTAPIWTTVGAWLILGQPIGRGLWLGLACGFIGIILVQRPHMTGGNVGGMAGAAAGALVAVAQFARRRLRHIPASLMVSFYSVVLLAIAVSFVVLSHSSIPTAGLTDPVVIITSAMTALLGTTGNIAVTKATALAPVQTVSASGYASIGLAALADLLWFGMTPQPLALCGLILTLVPTLILIFQRPRARQIFRESFELKDPLQAHLDMREIESAISKAEAHTSCELRVHVDRGLVPLSPERLEDLFSTLGMTKTKLRNGMLIAVSLVNAEIYFIADVGILEVVSARSIRRVARSTASAIEQSGAGRAISEGIATAANHLVRCFPVQDDDINELSNEVTIS